MGRGRLWRQNKRPAELIATPFGLNDLPFASLVASALGLDPTLNWLIADPVHLEVDRDRALLTPLTDCPLSTEESIALLATLNAHFAAESLHFMAANPGRWLVLLEEPPDVHFASLLDVVAEDIYRHLPQGVNKLYWGGLMNSIQMLFYEHPINLQRAARDVTTVNSVWLWGAGQRVAVQKPDGVLLSDDPDMAFLARHCAAILWPAPASLSHFLTRSLPSHAYILLPAVYDAMALAQLEKNWFAPLWQALRQGEIHVLDLICDGQPGIELRVKRTDWWKIWRRPKASLP